MVQLTMLNSMAGKDFVNSLDTQKAWGIEVLDLKSDIFGKSIIDLTPEEAHRANKEIQDRGLSVYCFSTELFYDDIEIGEEQFRLRNLAKVEQTIEVAKVLKPAVIRLLAARSSRRQQFANSVDYMKESHPWVIPMYREAIDMLAAAGFQATIENECRECIFSTPDEIIAFFRELNCGDKVYFTYDVQNLWEMGTFPSMEVYQALAPLIGFYHVKGGQHDGDTLNSVWKSTLEDASWPVAAITSKVVAAGISPVICINPCHGKLKPDYNYENMTKRDLDYMTSLIKEAN